VSDLAFLLISLQKNPLFVKYLWEIESLSEDEPAVSVFFKNILFLYSYFCIFVGYACRKFHIGNLPKTRQNTPSGRP